MWHNYYRPRSRASARLPVAKTAAAPQQELDRVSVCRARIGEAVGEELFWHWSWLLAPETTVDLSTWA